MNRGRLDLTEAFRFLCSTAHCDERSNDGRASVHNHAATLCTASDLAATLTAAINAFHAPTGGVLAQAAGIVPAPVEVLEPTAGIVPADPINALTAAAANSSTLLQYAIRMRVNLEATIAERNELRAADLTTQAEVERLRTASSRVEAQRDVLQTQLTTVD